MNYRDIIILEPDKRSGKPCIRGMRITAYYILEYLSSGISILEILDNFPYLTQSNILASLNNAVDREKHMREDIAIGYGDYTEERRELFKDQTLDDLVSQIKQRRKRKAKAGTN